MRSLSVIAALLAFPLLTQSAAAQGKAERLYVIECGSRTAPDVSLWTPGINAGKPIGFVDTCYVIKHGNDWMVWDTGLPDAIFSAPLTDPFAWRRTNTLAGELDKIGIKPSDVKVLAVSHSHPDHIGNVELFPQAMLLAQQAEYDWPNQNGSPRFTPSHPVTKLGITTCWGRQRDDHIDAGPHAWASVSIGKAAGNRGRAAVRRRFTPQGQLGRQARPGHQRR